MSLPFRRGLNLPRVDDHVAPLRDQPLKRILYPDRAGVGRGTVIYYIEPIAIAKVAGLGPFVRAELDFTRAHAAIDLDGDGAAVGAPDVEIEAAMIVESLGSGLCVSGWPLSQAGMPKPLFLGASLVLGCAHGIIPLVCPQANCPLGMVVCS